MYKVMFVYVRTLNIKVRNFCTNTFLQINNKMQIPKFSALTGLQKIHSNGAVGVLLFSLGQTVITQGDCDCSKRYELFGPCELSENHCDSGERPQCGPGGIFGCSCDCVPG